MISSCWLVSAALHTKLFALSNQALSNRGALGGLVITDGGKVALVTGSTMNIGRATALHLARE